MVCYFALQNYVHTWVCSGTSCYSAYKTIKMNAVSNGKPCTLTYQNWLKSCDGFVSLLDIDKSQAFSCPTCGIAPKYFVGDGKCVGPLRRKLEGLNINELGCHPDDNTILPQGSQFHKRQFLPEKKERDIVLELVTGSIDMNTFTSNKQIKSNSGKLLQDLVKHINSKCKQATEERRKQKDFFLTPCCLGSALRIDRDDGAMTDNDKLCETFTKFHSKDKEGKDKEVKTGHVTVN